MVDDFRNNSAPSPNDNLKNDDLDSNDIKTSIEYRKDEMGRTIKIIRKLRLQLQRTLVSKDVAERKMQWRKFGDAARDGQGLNMATTVLGEPVYMVPIINRSISKVRKKLIFSQNFFCPV